MRFLELCCLLNMDDVNNFRVITSNENEVKDFQDLLSSCWAMADKQLILFDAPFIRGHTYRHLGRELERGVM